ncbi:hypothetical protein QAD02_007904 [Eretmocerus hayati]|uniref:Uncharacterized protein n=1 Tax=Eretmocerus hayati TaxID=131215 RepID=A0ACC2N4Y9_9HYME|nr:hypothetical protein QAD02_007904 [Eretmocerus hayati]
MRGRKGIVPPEELYEALKDLHVFKQDGTLKPQSDDVWETARTRLHRQITVKNIHVNVSGNRNDLQKRLARQSGIEFHVQADENPVASSEVVAPTDSLAEINILKHDTLLSPMFKGSGGSPFYAFYWFPDQAHLWKELIGKFNKTVALCKFDEFIMNGHVFGVPTGELSFYSVFTQCCGKMLSFCHFVGEKTAEAFLLDFFIGVFLREESLAAPKCILVEPQMLETIIPTFNEVSTTEYNSLCLTAFFSGEGFPRTIVKIDAFLVIEHVEVLLRKHFKLQNVVQFFVSSFLFISTLDDITLFDEALGNIFIVLLSKYFHDKASTSRQFYADIINQEPMKQLKGKYSTSKTNSSKDFKECIDRLKIEKSEIFRMFKLKKETMMPHLDSYPKPGDCEINPYYNKEALDDLMVIFSLFPLWTNLPKAPESTPVSLVYQDLRNSYSNFGLNFPEKSNDGTICKLTPEEFLKKHAIQLIDSFSGWRELSKIAKNHYKGKTRQLTQADFHAHLNLIENWMNRGNKFVFVREEKQLDALHEIDNSQNNSELVETLNMEMGNSTHDLELSAISLDHSYSKISNNVGVSTAEKIDQPSRRDLKHSTPEEKCGPNKKKPKNKYITPCPNLEIIYNMPKKKGKFKTTLLRNGNKLCPKKIVPTEPLYKIASTCLIDSLAELLAHGIMLYSSFHYYCSDAVKHEAGQVIQMMYDYATKGNIPQFYKNRALYMFAKGEKCKDILKYDKPISAFLEEALVTTPSLMLLQVCNPCGGPSKKENPLYYLSVMIDSSNLQRIDIGINESISNLVQNNHSFCDNCLNSKSVSVKIGPYLAIIPTNSENIDFQKLQSELTFDNNHYFLVGVVGFTKPAVEISQNHYIAYVKSIHGGWLKKDNLHDRVTRVPKTCTSKLALILYVYNIS